MLAGHSADPLDLLGRPFLDFLADVLEAVNALLDEFLVLPAIVKDVPHHAVEHRNIGAGTQPDIFGGVGRRSRQPRIDDDEIRFVQLSAFQQMLHRNRMCLGRIAAPDQNGLGVADIVEGVGHGAVAPAIGDASDRGRVTDASLVIGIVGAPKRAELAEQIGAFVGHLGGAEQIDRIRPGLLADRHKLVADLADRLVPADPRPLPVDHLHRIFQPAFAAHQLAHRRALGAVRATVDGAVPARLLSDPDVVGDFRRYRAADGAMGADTFADGDFCAGRRRRAGLGLAHRAELQHAQRRETAGREAGAAQEGAAVEAAVQLPWQCAGEDAAACMTFRPLDQHGGLLHFAG